MPSLWTSSASAAASRVVAHLKGAQPGAQHLPPHHRHLGGLQVRAQATGIAARAGEEPRDVAAHVRKIDEKAGRLHRVENLRRRGVSPRAEARERACGSGRVGLLFCDHLSAILTVIGPAGA